MPRSLVIRCYFARHCGSSICGSGRWRCNSGNWPRNGYQSSAPSVSGNVGGTPAKQCPARRRPRQVTTPDLHDTGLLLRRPEKRRLRAFREHHRVRDLIWPLFTDIRLTRMEFAGRVPCPLFAMPRNREPRGKCSKSFKLDRLPAGLPSAGVAPQRFLAAR